MGSARVKNSASGRSAILGGGGAGGGGISSFSRISRRVKGYLRLGAAPVWRAFPVEGWRLFCWAALGWPCCCWAVRVAPADAWVRCEVAVWVTVVAPPPCG